MLIHFENNQFCYGTFHPYFSFKVYHMNLNLNSSFCKQYSANIFSFAIEKYSVNIFSFAIMCSGDIVTAAGGNYTSMAATGGVVAIHIKAKITLVSYLFFIEYLCKGYVAL